MTATRLAALLAPYSAAGMVTATKARQSSPLRHVHTYPAAVRVTVIVEPVAA